MQGMDSANLQEVHLTSLSRASHLLSLATQGRRTPVARPKARAGARLAVLLLLPPKFKSVPPASDYPAARSSALTALTFLSSIPPVPAMSITKHGISEASNTPQAASDKRTRPNYGACAETGKDDPAGQAGASREGPIDALASLLTHFADAPEHNQDNPDILTGYRRPTDSWAVCLGSAGAWHNETVNVSATTTLGFGDCRGRGGRGSRERWLTPTLALGCRFTRTCGRPCLRPRCSSRERSRLPTGSSC